MTFETYRSIIFSFTYGLLFVEIAVALSLPNRLLANIIEYQFSITRSDKEKLIMNFYGIKISFLSSRRFRLSLIFQLVIILWIVGLVCFDGWILQLNQLPNGEACPSQPSDCFNFNSLASNERLYCEPGEILVNATSKKAICFSWMYNRINAMQIINQLGIATSIFSLLSFAFKIACYISRKWYGLIFIILLTLGATIVNILAYTFTIYISITAMQLITGLGAICSNVAQLYQFTYSYEKEKIASMKY